jgi:NADH-quinone oxidoreductase subunit J
LLALLPIAICCACAGLSALAVVLLRRPVHVALGLLFHSLSMAALYLTLDAQFAAVAQVLIYSGAIVVLFLIVVALLPEGGREALSAQAVGGAAAVFVAMASAFGAVLFGLSNLGVVDSSAPSVKEVGAPLFAELLVPFEMTAPLLLTAIVAAITLWRRQEGSTDANRRTP